MQRKETSLWRWNADRQGLSLVREKPTWEQEWEETGGGQMTTRLLAKDTFGHNHRRHRSVWNLKAWWHCYSPSNRTGWNAYTEGKRNGLHYRVCKHLRNWRSLINWKDVRPNRSARSAFWGGAALRVDSKPNRAWFSKPSSDGRQAMTQFKHLSQLSKCWRLSGDEPVSNEIILLRVWFNACCDSVFCL